MSLTLKDGHQVYDPTMYELAVSYSEFVTAILIFLTCILLFIGGVFVVRFILQSDQSQVEDHNELVSNSSLSHDSNPRQPLLEDHEE